VDTVIIKSANDEDIHADKVNSSQYLKEHYIAGNQEYCSHIIAAGNTIRFMRSAMHTFDTDAYIKGINKSPNATEIVDHSQYAPIFERILASIDYEGFCCFDYKIVNGRPCVFELNPRYCTTMSRFIQEALPVYCQVIEERRGVRHSFA
jgi:predicted ATP-grasp superfamily ATP-dependent carboligase